MYSSAFFSKNDKVSLCGDGLVLFDILSLFRERTSSSLNCYKMFAVEMRTALTPITKMCFK